MWLTKDFKLEILAFLNLSITSFHSGNLVEIFAFSNVSLYFPWLMKDFSWFCMWSSWKISHSLCLSIKAFHGFETRRHWARLLASKKLEMWLISRSKPWFASRTSMAWSLITLIKNRVPTNRSKWWPDYIILGQFNKSSQNRPLWWLTFKKNVIEIWKNFYVWGKWIR